MKNKKLLNYQEILNKKFKPSKNGYSPIEVDEFLDEIIELINFYDKKVEERDKNIEALKNSIQKLNQDNVDLKKELETLKKTYKNIKAEDIGKYSNYDLIKKVNIYESKLLELGIDITDLNKTQSE